ACARGDRGVLSEAPASPRARAAPRAQETTARPLQLLRGERQRSSGLAAAVLGHPDLEEVALAEEPALGDDVGALQSNGACATPSSTEAEAALAVVSDVRRLRGRAGWWKSPRPVLVGATGGSPPVATRPEPRPTHGAVDTSAR